ncbi:MULTISPECIES: hypothetical protein [Amycolatopsis]|uniref:Uncharacterized protein n=1 Tax=Amycolatopsis bullii TaxID=941987 RepID=A0ABQ3KCT3_9PSEU|nr:hypothetical protein [Amycolatopsis bullii]GHG12913.1 hypothetical protein GCM10017567_32830 [Amycolatopsis bullii]
MFATGFPLVTAIVSSSCCGARRLPNRASDRRWSHCIANAIRNNVVHVKLDEIVRDTDAVAELLVDDTTTVQQLVQVADRDRRVQHGDDRPLREADIRPTDKLIALPLRRPAPRFRT